MSNHFRLSSCRSLLAALAFASPAAMAGAPSENGGAGSPRAAALSSGPAFVVQAGAFRHEESAHTRCEPLANQGLPLNVARQGDRGGGEALFVCRSAPLPDRAAARALAARVRERSVQDVIVVAVAATAESDSATRGTDKPSAGTATAERSRIAPELRREFQAFMQERESRTARRTGAATTPSNAAVGGSTLPVANGASSPPEARATASAEARLDGGRLELRSLGDQWCSDLVIHDGLPPMSWTFVAPRRVRVTVPIVAGASRGQMRARDETIEALADGRVRLVDDTAAFYTETIFAVERRALRGVSHRRVDKRTGIEKVTLPDSFRRCAPH